MDNKKRKFLKNASAVTLLGAVPYLSSCGSGSSNDGSGGNQILNVPFVRQQTQVWCWAAVCEMILRYSGVIVPQCQIVSETVKVNCCQIGGVGPCLTTAPIQHMQAALFYYGRISTSLGGAPSFDSIRRSIEANRPIVAAYQGSFSGHVVVVYGYDAGGNIYVHDPFYRGNIVVPYTLSFAYNGNQFWNQSIYIS